MAPKRARWSHAGPEKSGPVYFVAMTSSIDRIARVSPETAVLLVASRPAGDAPRDSAVLPLSVDGVDGNTLALLAGRHGVTPLLSNWLAQHPRLDLPTTIRERIGSTARLVSQRNLLMVGTLLQALRRLDDVAVEAVPYKGPVLAELAYGSTALRSFGDLDVIVRPQQVHAAVTALRDLGFAPPAFESALQQSSPLPSEGQILLRNAATNIDLELHWSFFQRYHGYSIDLDSMLAERQTVVVAGQPVSTFSLADTMLLLCLHHSKHRWERLVWIRDIAGMIERHPTVDWDAVHRSAERLGGVRALLLGVRLAHELYGVAVPARLHDEAMRNAEVEWLYEHVLQSLTARQGVLSESSERTRFHLRVRDSLVDRLRFAVRRLFVPSLEDRQAVRLPRPLFVLYSLIRPFRIAAKRLHR